MPLEKLKIVHKPDEYWTCQNCGYHSPYDFCKQCGKPSQYFTPDNVKKRQEKEGEDGIPGRT